VSVVESAAKVMQAALAEAGADPEILYVRDGRLFWRHQSGDQQVAWRAYSLGWQSVNRPAVCLACFVAGTETDLPGRRVLWNSCSASVVFTRDCGEVSP